MVKFCLVCGKAFEDKFNKGKKYCSGTCKNKSYFIRKGLRISPLDIKPKA